MLTPRVRRVLSRTRSLNRSTAFGSIRRWGTPAFVKLKTRCFRSQGLATALICSLTLRFVVMNRVMLSITPSQDQRLRTHALR
ncbi:hypothetical protein [uncultured Paludibaculum sp.]|uniref:hypothetical protein n=1 Tax=uncultured Paludibaculum sp. TaxID=1765020 RepID=UPI002AABBBB3|nr:hypothetical protein [uncultured Paludibaculum sp.]